MRHVVSIGGGFSSTIELPIEVIRNYGAANVDLVICALKGESNDLWRLVDECERLNEKPVTRVSYSPEEERRFAINAPPETWWGIWDVFFDQGMMGNPFVVDIDMTSEPGTILGYAMGFDWRERAAKLLEEG